jgi:hypothetical protein
MCINIEIVSVIQIDHAQFRSRLEKQQGNGVKNPNWSG